MVVGRASSVSAAHVRIKPKVPPPAAAATPQSILAREARGARGNETRN